MPRVAPLSNAEKAAITQRIEYLNESHPDAIRLMNDLFALGLVEGKRCLKAAGPVEQFPNPPPGAITMEQISLGSMADMKDKMKRENEARHGHR